MNIHKMIAELQAEKERLDEAILALERLSAGKVKKRSKSSPQAEPEPPPQVIESEPAALKARGHS
jgi:hypothetical protein